MTSPHAEDPSDPGPELLAAYADGELDGEDVRALRERVETWLAEHPEAAAELASLQRLREAWQAAAPPDPGDEALDAVRDRVRQALAAAPSRPGLRRYLAWGAGGTAAAAAAFWLALSLLSGSAPPAPQPEPAPRQAKAEPYPVATEDEVEILHVEGEDTGTLAVGVPPVDGPLELAGPGDVNVKSVQPARPDNMVPDVMLDGPMPMIWARADGERE